MTTLSINPTKSSSFEFNVSMQGLEEDSNPSIRFVIQGVYDSCDVSLNCSKVREDTWSVNIPAGLELAHEEYKFRLEVVVNEYYFEPTEGKLLIVGDPEVKFEESVRPTITTSFSPEILVEEEDLDDDLVLDEPVEESVEEGPPVEIVPPLKEPKTTGKKKSLLDRDIDGKPLLKGIDSLDVIKTRQEKAEKLKKILGQPS